MFKHLFPQVGGSRNVSLHKNHLDGLLLSCELRVCNAQAHTGHSVNVFFFILTRNDPPVSRFKFFPGVPQALGIHFYLPAAGSLN